MSRRIFDKIVADAVASFQPRSEHGLNYVPLYPTITLSKTRLKALQWAQLKLSQSAAVGSVASLRGQVIHESQEPSVAPICEECIRKCQEIIDERTSDARTSMD